MRSFDLLCFFTQGKGLLFGLVGVVGAVLVSDSVSDVVKVGDLFACVVEEASLLVAADRFVAVLVGCMMLYPLLRLVIVWLKWFLNSSRLVQ